MANNHLLSNTAASNVSDLYEQFLQIKGGKRGCLQITKKHAKASGIKWSFVENSCEILGLKLTTQGRTGYLASRT